MWGCNAWVQVFVTMLVRKAVKLSRVDLGVPPSVRTCEGCPELGTGGSSSFQLNHPRARLSPAATMVAHPITNFKKGKKWLTERGGGSKKE